MENDSKRRRFDAAFKIEAVRLATEGGLSQAQVARQLGIEAKRISHWKKQLQLHGSSDRAFPGQGYEHDAELASAQRAPGVVRWRTSAWSVTS